MADTTHADDDSDLIGPIDTKIGENTDAVGTTTLFARLKQIIDNYLAVASGSSTLNDANTSDTIVPGSLPTNMHVVFDISNLNNNGDDFDLEVKVGVAASERVVAYYNLTSDGTDITADKGSGVGSIIKQRRIDISDTLVYTGEQVIVELTKNSATDRNVTYKYTCGV